MNAVFCVFLVVVTLSSITAQTPPPPCPVSEITSASKIGQGGSFFINRTLAEKFQTGLIKDAIISALNNTVTCNDITITMLGETWGDGVTWGTFVDFVFTSPTETLLQGYTSSVALPLPNALTKAARASFPTNGNAVTAIPSSAFTSFLINNQAVIVRQSTGQIIVIQKSTDNSTSIAPQPCTYSGWSECDGCARDKVQIVTRAIVKPAVGGGTCNEPTQMRMHCNKKCLTDWQIGLIALACFLFVVFICICLYCVCARRRPVHDPAKERAQQKANELATPPPAVDEKIDVDVVDPVRPSTGGDEPANFHRASSETGTGPRPTATFHDDDEPAETKPTPVPEEAKSQEPEAVAPAAAAAAAPPAGAPRANVVRVHL